LMAAQVAASSTRRGLSGSCLMFFVMMFLVGHSSPDRPWWSDAAILAGLRTGVDYLRGNCCMQGETVRFLPC
ncbi:MAG: hypothetical protein DIU65_06090, partial [Proteobacteria bacterium]